MPDSSLRTYRAKRDFAVTAEPAPLDVVAAPGAPARFVVRKVKCAGREAFVVVGWTPAAGSREGFGSLHVGYYGTDGNLHYAGGVGSGFDTDDLRTIRAALDGSEAALRLMVSGDPIDRTVVWVSPRLVIEASFTGWSGAGRLRHAVYLGRREDKDSAEVVRKVAGPGETPVPMPVPMPILSRQK